MELPAAKRCAGNVQPRYSNMRQCRRHLCQIPPGANVHAHGVLLLSCGVSSHRHPVIIPVPVPFPVCIPMCASACLLGPRLSLEREILLYFILQYLIFGARSSSHPPLTQPIVPSQGTFLPALTRVFMDTNAPLEVCT